MPSKPTLWSVALSIIFGATLACAKVSTDDLLTSPAIMGNGTREQIEAWLNHWNAMDKTAMLPEVRDALAGLAALAEQRLHGKTIQNLHSGLESISTGSAVGLSLFSNAIVKQPADATTLAEPNFQNQLIDQLIKLREKGAPRDSLLVSYETLLARLPSRNVLTSKALSFASSLYLSDFCGRTSPTDSANSSHPFNGLATADSLLNNMGLLEISVRRQLLLCAPHTHPESFIIRYISLKPHVLEQGPDFADDFLDNLSQASKNVSPQLQNAYAHMIRAIRLDLGTPAKELSTTAALQQEITDIAIALLQAAIEANLAPKTDEDTWFKIQIAAYGHLLLARQTEWRTLIIQDTLRRRISDATSLLQSQNLIPYNFELHRITELYDFGPLSKVPVK